MGKEKGRYVDEASSEVRYGPEGQVVIDHLDLSDSATVRRHAATFRQVRARLSDEAEGGWGVGAGESAARGYVDGSAEDVTGHGLRVLGAGSAARVAEEAAENGWRVTARFASHRRESDGAPIDAAVVAVARSDDGVGVTTWALGRWRTEVIRPPMKRKWKFEGGVASDAERGTRTVGARELAAVIISPPGGVIISPMSDALECDHVPVQRGGEGSDGQGRS